LFEFYPPSTMPAFRARERANCNKELAMRHLPIVITRLDAARLRELLATSSGSGRDQEHLDELALELERARIAATDDAPPDLVSIHSRLQVLDLASGKRRELVLVLPPESDPAAGRISVLAPLGTALLGQRAGDEVEWQMPGGLRRMCIESVEPAPGLPLPLAHQAPAGAVA
jgi:regulator of nucleoside diphosphate kinase